MLVGGGVTPALAYNSSCSIGIDNTSSLSADSFGSVNRQSMPGSVTKSTTITAKCAMSALAQGSYQWVLSPKKGTLSQVSGSTSPSILNAVTLSFNLSSSTMVVSASQGAATAVVATGTLSGLTTKITAGTYQLTETVDVERQICTTVCTKDGNKQTLTSTYTLTVVDQATTPVGGSGSGSVQACATPWAEGNTFTLGEVVSYESKNYKNIQPHTAYAGTGWTPPSTPALWSYVADCTTGAGDTGGTGGSTTPTTPVRHPGVVANPWTVNHGAARARMRCDCF
jgi:hypothetical protein